MTRKTKMVLAVLAVLVAFAVLSTEGPLRRLLLGRGWPKLEADLFAGVVVRLVLSAGFLWGLKRLKLLRFNGLVKGLWWPRWGVLVIPMAFLALPLLSNLDVYRGAETHILLLFALYTLCVGLAEEIIFRGTVLPLFISSFKNHKYVFYGSALMTALIFGPVHFSNLIREPENFAGVFRQVIFACALGVVLSAILLRSGSLFVAALFHGAVNFSLGASDIESEAVVEVVKKAESGGTSITGYVFTMILIAGFVMLRRVDRDAVMKRLQGV